MAEEEEEFTEAHSALREVRIKSCRVEVDIGCSWTLTGGGLALQLLVQMAYQLPLNQEADQAADSEGYCHCRCPCAGSAHAARKAEEFYRRPPTVHHMFAGALIFAMIIFYFVNWPDDDIKRCPQSVDIETWSICAQLDLVCCARVFILVPFSVSVCHGNLPSSCQGRAAAFRRARA